MRPWYVENADAAACYCETAAACPRAGPKCAATLDPDDPHAASPWGSSEGNCATPAALYRSAVDFMAAKLKGLEDLSDIEWGHARATEAFEAAVRKGLCRGTQVPGILDPILVAHEQKVRAHSKKLWAGQAARTWADVARGTASAQPSRLQDVPTRGEEGVMELGGQVDRLQIESDELDPRPPRRQRVEVGGVEARRSRVGAR